MQTGKKEPEPVPPLLGTQTSYSMLPLGDTSLPPSPLSGDGEGLVDPGPTRDGVRTFSWASVPHRTPKDSHLLHLTLSVLCPQASPAGEGASGTRIVCGASAPSSTLNLLSFFSSFSRFVSSRRLLGLLFCSSLLCRLMHQINAGGGASAEQGAPQLVSAHPGSVPPLRLPA